MLCIIFLWGGGNDLVKLLPMENYSDYLELKSLQRISMTAQKDKILTKIDPDV